MSEVSPEEAAAEIPEHVHREAERVAKNLMSMPPQTRVQQVRGRRKKYRTKERKADPE